MSAILESLLTPQQRAEAEAADRAEKARVLAHLTQQVRDLNELHFSELFTNDGSDSVKQAVTEALGCMDDLGDWLSGDCMGRMSEEVNAERVMRTTGRYSGADTATVICAAFLSAHRSDAEECMRAMREVAARFVADRAKHINARADELDAELQGDAE